jgi:glycosyltransferase involved in cell wall biosynthesis
VDKERYFVETLLDMPIKSTGATNGESIAVRLRILMVTARYIPYVGGTEIHTFEVARRMAAAGHDVTVLTTDVSKTLPRLEDSEGVRVVRVPAWPARSDYYFAPDIYKVIMGGRWDLIHCQGYHTLVAPLAMLAAYQSGTPYCVTFHSGGHPSRIRNSLRRVQRWLLRPLLARAQKLIAVSDFETEFFQQQLNQPPDRFETISNGSYLPKMETSPTGSNGTLIVSVGRLERHKGHHRTISALPEVAKQYPDVQLRIIGGGPCEPELWQLAQRYGVADRVNIGPIGVTERADMASILSEAKLAILLSDYESQGIAILEALSLGIPALVTHTSGLAELANGGLVRSVPLNSSSLVIASAILEQLHRPLLVSNINLPSWDECAAQLMHLYYEIHEKRYPSGTSSDWGIARQPNSRRISGTNGASEAIVLGQKAET